MSEHNYNSGGIYGMLTVVASWILTFITSFSWLPMLLSCGVSLLGIVNYVIIIRNNLKNKK